MTLCVLYGLLNLYIYYAIRQTGSHYKAYKGVEEDSPYMTLCVLYGLLNLYVLCNPANRLALHFKIK
jgi:hypothetical protein